MNYETIENLRKVMGTLPSERPQKRTEILSLLNSLEVSIEDSSENPYKAMFVTTTSTWGNNEFKSKWDSTSIEGKLEVIKAVLTHNTLPQAKEMVQFVVRVKGVPRWLFDYHTQTVQFISFMSIGCRDNNKIDSDIVKQHTNEPEKQLFEKLKDLYEEALGSEGGSWQTARAFLPQSYSHSYHFGQNLLSIVGVRGFHASGFFGNSFKEQMLKELYMQVVYQISKKFPLIAYYLQLIFSTNKEQKEFIFKQLSELTVDMLSEDDIVLLNKK